MTDIKLEYKLEDGMLIKPDPDDMDYTSDVEVEDEDTGELSFPRTTPQNSWLMRVPKDLWTGLNTMHSDGNIQIGELWEWKDETTGKTTTRWKIRPDLPGFDLIAKEYDLQPSKDTTGVSSSSNTFVFSEKEMAQRPFGSRAPVKKEREPFKKTDGGRIDKRKQQYQGPRSIPKHTAYVAAPQDEVQCHPRENAEWFALQTRKENNARENRARLTRVIVDQNVATADTDGFLKTQEIKVKPKKMQNKYQRMDAGPLISLIQECFKEYKYWAMKDLVRRLKQPETWLKQNLEEIAYLLKKGIYANKWTLKRSLEGILLTEEQLEAMAQQQEANAQAPEIPEDDDDDDDDDMEMINILG